MNIVLGTVKFIANLLLPKDKPEKLPPGVIHLPKELALLINNDAPPLAESERFESGYYLLTKNIACKRRVKTPLGEILAEWHCEELIKTENPAEGVFYFNDSWWKIKSGKSVYTAHLDKITDTNRKT